MAFLTCLNTQPSFNPSVLLVVLTEMLFKASNLPTPSRALAVHCFLTWSSIIPLSTDFVNLSNDKCLSNATEMYECIRLLGSCILPLMLLLVCHESPWTSATRIPLPVPPHGFVGLPDALKLPLEKVNDSETRLNSEIQSLLDKLSYL